MAGLYVHIPFCKSRCIYCAFYSTTNMELRQRYVNAVCREMEMRGQRNEIKGEKIGTIYIGGGTPSQLTLAQLRQLKESISNTFSLANSMEITIEVNPDDVTTELADGLRRMGVNRVSMGVQSFNDCRLRFLHRRHNASQVTTAIQTLRRAGFGNVSIDLMYGFPDETLDDWQIDIEAALALNVEHLSAYSLMVEEGTTLFDLVHKGQLTTIHEEQERAMYETLIDRLTNAGYEHYELSNFARHGYRSRHNSSYWHDIPYIGVGAAAHSYDGRHRSWNVSDLLLYIKGIEGEKPAYEWEELDSDTHYNDRVTVALRTCEGLSLDELSARHRDHLLHSAQHYIENGLLQIADNHVRLTRNGLFVSDMVMSDLMLV